MIISKIIMTDEYLCRIYTSAAAVINVSPVPSDLNHRTLITTIKMNHMKMTKPNKLSDLNGIRVSS